MRKNEKKYEKNYKERSALLTSQDWLWKKLIFNIDLRFDLS